MQALNRECMDSVKKRYSKCQVFSENLSIMILNKPIHIKGIFRFVLLIIGVCFFATVTAQKKQLAKKPMKRCGTMEALFEEMKTNAVLNQRVLQGRIDYENSKKLLARDPVPNTPLSLPGPVNIPVVVHVVLPNPWIITDDAVQLFIDRLNQDYSGTNADSTNGSFFYSVRGHSLIRFTLAKRDPSGNFTTGVIRVAGITPIEQTTDQPIKRSSTQTGGSTGWDVSRYYNLYVGDGTAAGLLGIAPAIGPGGAAGSTNADGVCVDYRCFSSLCFSYPEYQLSRTSVHEIGHNFGLYHPFDNGCATNDFAQLTTGGCLLPANLLAPADDIPVQNEPTGGCPPPGISNNCSPAQVRMFQNYMDYTDDACYSMFTKGEVARMEWVLEHCRAGYLTTTGGQYPDNMKTLDAAVSSVVSPGGFDFDSSNCAPVSYAALTCPGSFIPKLRIINQGTAILTSVTITTTINGLNPVSQTFTVNLATGKSQVLTLQAQTAVTGNNLLKFTVSAPNNGSDENTTNDELTLDFTVAAALAIPYTESFESAVFPPANGTIVINDDGGKTWERSTDAARPGSASMKINYFDYPPDDNNNLGQKDIYRMPAIDLSNFDSLKISFNVAYRQYFGPGVSKPPNDTLMIIYSPDCGNTWLPAGYMKSGATLSTVNGTTEDDFKPANASQWRTDSLVIKDFCSAGLNNIVLAFMGINNYGNNIYIDSIDIKGYQSFNTNAILRSILQPLPALCTQDFTARIEFGNAGQDTLRHLEIKYVVDNSTDTFTTVWNGALAKCQNVQLDLAPYNAPVGTHVLKIFLTNPNNIPDQAPSNDTAVKTFTVYNTASLPLAEDFENSTFPATGWGVQNVNGGNTFEKTIEAARSGAASLVIKNKSAINPLNALDYFITPIITNNTNADSIFLDFDLAYRAGNEYPGSTTFPLDTLEILATSDCGNTFSSAWKKWGYELQTVSDPNYSNTDTFKPASATEWKHVRIDLKPYLVGNYQLYFAMKGNRQNSLWIDNVNITDIVLPQKLKEQGYLIYPNPFNSTFRIHHYAVNPPVDLQSVQVYNSAGQLVWQKQYNGNAERQIIIDLAAKARGLYIVKLIYTNKTVVEKIVKD